MTAHFAWATVPSRVLSPAELRQREREARLLINPVNAWVAAELYANGATYAALSVVLEKDANAIRRAVTKSPQRPAEDDLFLAASLALARGLLSHVPVGRRAKKQASGHKEYQEATSNTTSGASTRD